MMPAIRKTFELVTDQKVDLSIGNESLKKK